MSQATNRERAADVEDAPEAEVEVTETVVSNGPPTCMCGCGSKIGPNARFAPGHDGKLRKRLYDSIRQGSAEDAEKATAALTVLGWPMPKSKATDPKVTEQREALAKLGI